jgi:hypothetical protein
VGGPTDRAGLWSVWALGVRCWKEINNSLPTQVPLPLIIKVREARTLAASIIATATEASYESVVDILKNSWENLKETDITIIIEKAIMMNAEVMLDTAFQHETLATLPVEGNLKSIERTLLLLTAIPQVASYNMASLKIQRSFQLVLQTVQGLDSGVAPPISLMQGSSLVQAAYNRMQYFYTREFDEGGHKVTKAGNVAMQAYFKAIRGRMDSDDKKQVVAIKELEDFHEFKWMLSVAEQAELIKWVKKLTREEVAPKASSAASSSSAPAPKLKTNGNKAEILKYFKPRK